MNDVTQHLPPDFGGGGPIWPGLIMPAAILLIALLSAAAVVIVNGPKDTGGRKNGHSGSAPRE